MLSETCKTLQERGGWWEDVVANRCNFPIAPWNTVSNLAYAVAGVIAVTQVPNLAGGIFCLFMVFLAVSSALYHGTKRGWAARLDNGGMYAGFSALTIYSLSPTNPYIGPLMALIAAILVWRLAYGANTKNLLNPMMGVFIAISTLSVALNGILEFAVLGLGIAGFAYVIWWLDKRRNFFFPRLGHAIWHVLTAGAMLILFLGVK